MPKTSGIYYFKYFPFSNYQFTIQTLGINVGRYKPLINFDINDKIDKDLIGNAKRI
jgi:hypothetical protein